MSRGHRFTEPTPGRGEPAQIVIAGWEIECCAPAPVVGGVTSWMLEYVVADGPPDPLLDHELPWSVSPPQEGVVRLDHGAVVAFWSFGPPAAPPPGPARMAGTLWGTAHGGISPEGFPECRGRVERIRVLSQEYRLTAVPRHWEPVPGSRTVADVAESPCRFGGDRPEGPSEFAILVDLRVDPRLPLPADG